MTDGEIRSFLASAEWLALGVLDVGGAPFAIPVPIVSDGVSLTFAVPAGSAAEVALLRDPRCCGAIDSFPSYYEIKGVTVHGRATPYAPPTAVAARLEERGVRHGIAGSVCFSLPIAADAFGFDFAKITRR